MQHRQVLFVLGSEDLSAGALMPEAIEASLLASELRASARPIRDLGFDPPTPFVPRNEAGGSEGLGAMTAEHGDGASMGRCITSSLRTTYFGHQISIEPAEWGFQALVAEPRSGVRLIAVSKSAMQALENAFDIIDDRMNQQKNLSRDS